VPQALDCGEQISFGGDVEIVKQISFSWSFGWWLSLKRQRVSTRFSFSVLNFPRFQEWSVVFTRIRESVSISFFLLF
jgi:hypothetical protein